MAWPGEIIEIDDDSSDDQRTWTKPPTPLHDVDTQPFVQRGLHAERRHPFGARPFDTTHHDLSDPVPAFDDWMDPDFVDMNEFAMSSSRPEANLDVSTGYDGCLKEVLEIFPDISHDHVQEVYNISIRTSVNGQPVAQDIISQILDKGKYPKEKDRLKELKRKRFADSDDEEFAYLKNLERDEVNGHYSYLAKLILQEDFPDIPRKYIDLKFKETRQFFATYEALELANRTWEDLENPPYEKLKRTRLLTLPQVEELSWLDGMVPGGYGLDELKREIVAARKLRRKEEAKQKTTKDITEAEAAKEKEARDNGDILECNICCDDLPSYKFTHCDGDLPHFLCFGCLQRYADTEIGNQRYILECLHDGGCKATFSYREKKRALTSKTLETLERLQQQAELKLANMEGLANCPFCDFAAICPPVKVDKEFRCHNPECERVSCRLCQKESHVPMSCKEYKDTLGIDERHAVEEAMTKALLKTCPKCGKQVLKQDGCNKIVCFCGGIMCDYCGKDITKHGYGHFGGPMAGASGKCPTHDNFHERRQEEVKKAEAEAIRKARLENPDLTEAQLKLKFSQEVENGYSTGPMPDRVMPFIHGPGLQQLPNIGVYPAHIREDMQNRLGIPAIQGVPPGAVPGLFPHVLAPEYRPLPVHNYMPPYMPPGLPPRVGVPLGGAAHNHVPGNQPPAPQPQHANLQDRVRAGFPVTGGFNQQRGGQENRADQRRAPEDKSIVDVGLKAENVTRNENSGRVRRPREAGVYDPGMLGAMHGDPGASRQDWGLPVDIVGASDNADRRQRRERRHRR